MEKIDDLDRKILKTLLRDAGVSKAEAARRLGIAASVFWERLRRLSKAGIVRRQETRLDAAALGYPVLAYVFVTEGKPLAGPPAGAALAGVEGVEEVHKIAGDDCYLVKLRARSNAALAEILDTGINPIPGVSGVRTTIVLRTIKEDVALGGVAAFRETALTLT